MTNKNLKKKTTYKDICFQIREFYHVSNNTVEKYSKTCKTVEHQYQDQRHWKKSKKYQEGNPNFDTFIKVTTERESWRESTEGGGEYLLFPNWGKSKIPPQDRERELSAVRCLLCSVPHMVSDRQSWGTQVKELVKNRNIC